MVDLTVALTAHAETVVAGPTMESAEAALRQAEAAGFSVQRLLGFDTCTAACRRYMTQPKFAAWDSHDFQFRDQGKSRNALADLAKGRYLAFLDGDDLFSENWLLEALQCLTAAREQGDDRLIVHPEVNWVFDAGQYVYDNPDQDSMFFSPRVMTLSNYYDALCMAPRALWQQVRYADRAVKQGFAYEDYQWAVEATALGWRHAVARDTLIFKRRRDASQTHEARGHSVMIRAVEPLAIDQVDRILEEQSAEGTGG